MIRRGKEPGYGGERIGYGGEIRQDREGKG